MSDNIRLIVNTLAQNVRTVLNIVLSLYSTRIVIDALGESDYGIYMLVAGIVSLLSYLSNTLIITTQRHLSYVVGANKTDEAKSVFANSYMLHWLLGLALVVFCLFMTNYVFNSGILNIRIDKIVEAKAVYFLVVASVLLTFVTSPYKALLIAHENIVFISIVDVLDGILKLGLVFMLFLFDEWRLPLYAVIMAGIMFFHFLMLMVYCQKTYAESSFFPQLHLLNYRIQRQIMGFATWTLYGMFCIYVRTQGVAVLVNRMFGTVANAAWGIATQVFGSIQFLSQAIINAISPQIIKAEGANNRSKSIRLSLMASKYCYLMLAIVVIPISFEIPAILNLWLKDVPAFSAVFCQVMLISSLVDQISIGLGILNQAIGQIRIYTLITFSIKVLVVPVGMIFVHYGLCWQYILLFYFLFELISAVARIPLLVFNAGIRVKDFFCIVFCRVLTPTIVMFFIGYIMVNCAIEWQFRFVLTMIFCVVTGIISILFTSLDEMERLFFFNMIKKILKQ